MIVPSKYRRQARELFALACEGGRVAPERARQIAERLAAEKPRGAVPVLAEFTRLVRLNLERFHATIETAVPVDPLLQTRLLDAVQRRWGGTLTHQFRVRPELIGGVRIQVGSDVWDASLRARLEALQKQL